MEKKNNLLMIIAVVVVVLVMAFIIVKNNKQEVTPESETSVKTEVELNKAITSDTTVSINESLDQIDLTDTSGEDMQEIDQEMQNL